MARTYDGAFYLALRPHGGRVLSLAARLTNKRPALASDEIAVRIAVTLPETLFNKPQFEAKISVDSAGITPALVSVDMASNIAAVVRDQLGVHMTVTAEPTKEPT